MLRRCMRSGAVCVQHPSIWRLLQGKRTEEMVLAARQLAEVDTQQAVRGSSSSGLHRFNGPFSRPHEPIRRLVPSFAEWHQGTLPPGVATHREPSL